MTAFDSLQDRLRSAPARWLVTGAGGFIGSNLIEALLRLGQKVTGFDNFSTGVRANLTEVRGLVGETAWKNLTFVEADIRDRAACLEACKGADYVLHQAALGSVPLSIDRPVDSHDNNLNGFLSMLLAAREAGVRSFVYASSSSVYGDHPALPKREAEVGKVLSPYAATKMANEIYAQAFAAAYGLKPVGLRYFNIFGPRQDPNSAYAAVIPAWFDALLKGRRPFINGDGETSRDFCFIANVVQANLLAATAETPEAFNRAYNVAVGDRTTLNQLFAIIRSQVAKVRPEAASIEPVYRDFRAGDVRHSLADVSAARTLLGYEPTHDLAAGMELAAPWYVNRARQA